MVAEKQRKTMNQLKSMYPLRAKVNETYLKSIEAMQAAKPAVWAMLNFYYGDPIFKVMDTEVVCPENYDAIAAVMLVAQQYLDRADAMANNARKGSVSRHPTRPQTMTWWAVLDNRYAIHS